MSTSLRLAAIGVGSALVTSLLVVAGAEVARAYQLSGIWVGKRNCTGFGTDHGKIRIDDAGSTLLVLQSGKDVTIERDGTSTYRGLTISDPAKPEKGELAVVACGTDDTFESSTAKEVGHLQVKTNPGKGTGVLQGTSEEAQSFFTDSIVTCKWSYKRSRVSFPSVSDCSGEPVPTPASTPGPGGQCGNNVELTITTKAGSEFDRGWTGISHNEEAISGATVSVDLDNCNAGTCTIDGTPLVGKRFGGPLPLSSGGVPVCVLNTIREPITGTYDCGTGCAEWAVKLTSSVFLVQDIAKPCPICVGDPTANDGQKGGTCQGGTPAAGQPCDVNGVSAAFGATSNDCLPSGSSVGDLAIDLVPLTTGTASVTADASCVSQTAIAPCVCPGQNRANACDSGICGVDGTCGDDTQVEGLCSNQKFRSCIPDTGTADCEDVFPGAGTCVTTLRPCFGDTITRTGQCGTATSKLVSVFCMPATKAPAINVTAGLPGPATLSLPISQIRVPR